MFAIETGPQAAAALAPPARGGGSGANPAPAPSPSPTPAPTPTFTTIVIEGDSISRSSADTAPPDNTSTPQPTDAAGFFPYRWRATRADKAIYNRGAGSRTIGGTNNLDDNSNTIFGNLGEDVGFRPDLIVFKIGANDFTTASDAAYRTRLIALRAAYANARPAMKVAWSAPIAYNPTGTPHAQKANFDTQRASLLADCRDPAVWSQWADYYNPMGEHPDFADPAVAAPLFGDSVHPSGDLGQAALASVFGAFMNSLLDAGRAGSTTMYASAWTGSETNLATNTQIVRRIIVQGLAHTGSALGASVTGGGAEIRVGGRAWSSGVGTSSGNGHRIYNGDVLELRLTTSASNDTPVSVDLRIGSETRTITFRTVAQVAAAGYVQGGTAERAAWPNGGTPTVHVVRAISFPATGTGIIAVATGEADANKPTAVTWNGAPCAEVFGHSGWTSLALYRVPVTAGVTGDVVVSYGAARNASFISFGTLTNAHPVPVSALAGAASNGAHPSYVTAMAAVPASGIAVGFLQMGGNAAEITAGSIAGAGNTQIVSGLGGIGNGQRIGLIGGIRTASGAVGFRFDRYDGHPVGIAVFKAAGT